ncbi:hypothetical protein GQ53DRAFT_856173 [Thozetella sp. PMI_491]|nr:hypothetical protein GQ53DRAFT_856173 [Thozetella sp. PMI_491]
MHFNTILGLAALWGSAASTLPSIRGALYFEDNNPNGTDVISLKVGWDGLLSSPVRTPTAGLGQYALLFGNVPATDTTLSSDSVFVSGDKLFVVNTGSNTLSYFRIPANNPTHPVLVGTPGKVFGDFPNTVTYSPRHNLACVAATGMNNPGITCFDVTPSGLVVKGQNLPLPIHQTTPPDGPQNTTSDIVFNPSESALFVTIKSEPDPTKGTQPGWFLAYSVHPGGVVSTTPVVSRPPELHGQFSMSFLGRDSRAVVSDLTFGASIVDISPSLVVTEEIIVNTPNEQLACWTVYDPSHDSIYVMDGGMDNITVVNPGSGEVRYQLEGVSGSNGVFDAKQDRDFLYTLLGIQKIAVYNLTGSPAVKPTLLQVLDLSSLGNRRGWEGLALFIEE